MLTQNYRPKRFTNPDGLVGQAEAKSVLQAVVQNPHTAPRVYLLQGPRGLGKTSAARAFARALNCKHPDYGGACLTCENCKAFSDMSSAYQEYDATQVGNVAFIREMNDRLKYISSPDKEFRVVVLDEIHAASHSSQNALLKILEEGPRNTFFLLITTDVDKVLSTIRSRAVELPFVPVPDEEVRGLLKRIAYSENIEVPNAVMDSIVHFTFGYVREAVMRLSLYQQINNQEEFMRMVYVPEQDVIQLFLSARQKNRDVFLTTLQRLSSHPLAYLKKSVELFLLSSVKRVAVGEDPSLTAYDAIAQVYRSDVFSLLNILASPWAQNCFKSDLMFQSLMWHMYAVVSSGYSDISQPNTTSRFMK